VDAFQPVGKIFVLLSFVLRLFGVQCGRVSKVAGLYGNEPLKERKLLGKRASILSKTGLAKAAGRVYALRSFWEKP
jgi:hypothetical protein